MIGQLAAAASIDRNVVSTTSGRLMPSTPSRYSMPKASIQGSLTTACIEGSPSRNCAGPAGPKSAGTAIHSDSTNTTAVVTSVVQRMKSSRAFGTIGSDKNAATRAGRKTMADRGQRAGWTSVSVGDMEKSVRGSWGACAEGV